LLLYVMEPTIDQHIGNIYCVTDHDAFPEIAQVKVSVAVVPRDALPSLEKALVSVRLYKAVHTAAEKSETRISTSTTDDWIEAVRCYRATVDRHAIDYRSFFVDKGTEPKIRSVLYKFPGMQKNYGAKENITLH
jgi:hypothetical protein